MRRQIEAGPRHPAQRGTVRRLLTVALLVLLVLAQQYSAPYGTPIGQLLFAAYLVSYALVLLWMRRISRGVPAPRLLVATRESW
ncbi:hypothetical protein AB1285_27165 [Microbacterium sp. NRRL B-14842]|uniref:hypothetical protein n=1 Tax=Microbacterium sp. NRRL B-14842 TaxID=3162881 RepID=UPI003D27FCC8